jgi:hypothetical protein
MKGVDNVVAEYIIDFSGVEKVVGKKATEFIEEFDKFVVYLRLSELEATLSFSDFLCYVEGSYNLDYFIDIDKSAYATSLYIRDLFKECLSDFEEKCGVAINADIEIDHFGRMVGYLTLDLLYVDKNTLEVKRVDEYDKITKTLKQKGVLYEYNEVEWHL